MPRIARASVGGVFWHVMNGGNSERPVSFKYDDYLAFLKAIVAQAMQLGKYADADEAVGEGMLLILACSPECQRMREDLRREIDIGLRQLEEGQGIPFNEAAVDEILREGLVLPVVINLSLERLFR